MHATWKTLALSACLLSAVTLTAQDAPPPVINTATLAATPPMGWNSWNHFAGKVTDADVRAAADALVASGMRDAGYIYVNIDDTWEGKRDRRGVIHTNQKFPDMRALADYVHSKGLKLGIYSSPGPKTCAGYLGSYKHEKQDADTYASWGIDYLKYDMCSFGNIMEKKVGKQGPHTDPAIQEKRYQMERAAYEKMHDALVSTGRPITFSMCQYGWDDVWKWGGDIGGNLWRTTGDINDTYARMTEIGFSQAGLAKYAAPGHWNDPDMLEVGNGGMTDDEYRTHMSLWAILAAPLLAGNDLSKMTPATLAILTDKDVVGIDQDALGKQGDRVMAEGQTEVWSRPLTGGAQAVGVFNRADSAKPITLTLSEMRLSDGAKLHDVWAKRDVPADGGSVTLQVPSHGVVLLRASE